MVDFYEREETYRAKMEVKVNNVLTDPDDASYEIYDPDGTKVANGTMTKESTGVYVADYILPSNAALGEWMVICTATINTKPTIERSHFTVISKT